MNQARSNERMEEGREGGGEEGRGGSGEPCARQLRRPAHGGGEERHARLEALRHGIRRVLGLQQGGKHLCSGGLVRVYVPGFACPGWCAKVYLPRFICQDLIATIYREGKAGGVANRGEESNPGGERAAEECKEATWVRKVGLLGWEWNPSGAPAACEEYHSCARPTGDTGGRET